MDKVKVYVARAMSNRVKEEVVNEARVQAEIINNAGMIALCPVEKEQVEPTKQVLKSSRKSMQQYWPEDKRMIREAHVVFDMSPHMNSEGVKHEIGYARYCLWKPIVRVFPAGELPLASSVARFEDDYICDSLEDATRYVLKEYGTVWNRLKWRLKMLNRCLPKWILFQVQEFK